MEILTVQEREIVQEIPEIQVVGRSLEIEWRMVMARFKALGPMPKGARNSCSVFIGVS